MAKIATIGGLIVGVLVCAPVGAQTKEQVPNPAPPITATLIPDKENTVVGWLDIVPITSKILHTTRMLRVWVPGNYLSPHNAQRKYPVLYMQDGQNLFDRATAFQDEWQMDETADHLIGNFKIGQMFIVGIDSAGDGRQRAMDYLPYPDSLNPQSPGPGDVRGKDYAKFVVTEVMPFLQKRYRIATGAVSTGIGGSSYGAVISLYAALHYADTFGKVLLESPPLEVGDGQLLRDAEKATHLPQKMYIGVGTNEGRDAMVSAELVRNVGGLEKVLRDRGMGATRLKVTVEEGAPRNEAAWAKRLPEAMLFLYGK